jgi:ceramide glucosyltransferase
MGGFARFADGLADDYAMGAAIRALGLQVAIPDDLVDHACCERRVQEVFRHELRWARTIRGIDPAGHAASVVTHPLPFALVAALLQGLSWPSLALLAVVVACRLTLVRQANRLTADRLPLWLAPARDLLSFTIFACSFFIGVVSWRDQRYQVRGDGTLQPSGRPTR